MATPMPAAGGGGRFDGKVAVVTGGTQGLGEATARLMAQRGAAAVVISGRDADRGRAVATSLGCDSTFVAADLALPGAADMIVAAADDAYGRVDTVVSAAALAARGSVWDTTADLWDRMLAVNTRSPALLITAAARIMRREQIEGTIVLVGSISSHTGADFLYPYAASKLALQAVTRNAAWSLVRHRIRVNLIQPGWMATAGEDLTQRTYHGATDGWLERAGASQPFGRLIDPAEVARAICFLASAESGLMTGSVVDFDQSILGGGDAAKPTSDPVWGEEH
jgi:NAD(P)-dependent dehydrogenase (short-subunit alcohol dehydrogenase family)